MLKHMPKGYYGVDKMGRPIKIERSSFYETHKVFEIVTQEEFWLDWSQECEK